MKYNVAIDGPSSAGKSTISKAIAKELGLIHIDTGAMYRATAYAIKKNGIDYNNIDTLSIFLESISIDFSNEGDILLNNEKVNDFIRTDEISMLTSKISSIEIVRKKLVQLQQHMSEKKGYILDGRDIGTVVLPNAEIKIYMIASAECRAKRRYKEFLEKGDTVSYDEVYNSIVERDYNDMNRKISPLKKADDAIELDTSNLSVDEVVDSVREIINERLGV